MLSYAKSRISIAALIVLNLGCQICEVTKQIEPHVQDTEDKHGE